MIGIHGAGIANSNFLHADATIVEMMPDDPNAAAPGPGLLNPTDPRYPIGIDFTGVMQMSVAMGRRAIEAKDNMVHATNCVPSTWMRNSQCRLQVNSSRLVDLLRSVVPPLHGGRPDLLYQKRG